MQTVHRMTDGSGRSFSVPDDRMEDFAADFGDSAEEVTGYRVGDRSFSIPKSKADAFKADFPDAQALRRIKFADGSSKDMTVGEIAEFLRSDEYRNGERYAADREAARAEAENKARVANAGNEPESPSLSFAKELGKSWWENLTFQPGTSWREWMDSGSLPADMVKNANAFAGKMAQGIAETAPAANRVVGHLLGGRDTAAGRALMDAGDAQSAALQENINTETPYLAPGLDSVNDFTQSTLSTMARFSNPVTAATQIADTATQSADMAFEKAVENGASVEKASAMATAIGALETAKGMVGAKVVQNPFVKKILGNLASKLLGYGAKAAKTGAQMGALAGAEDIVEQGVEGAVNPDLLRTGEVTAKEFATGVAFDLVASGVHGVQHEAFHAEGKSKPKGYVQDLMETAQGRAAIMAANPEAAEAIIDARRNSQPVSRKMLSKMGVPDALGKTVEERNAIGDAFYGDYKAVNEMLSQTKRTKMDGQQYQALSEEVAKRVGSDQSEDYGAVMLDVVGRIKDAKELDDPYRREELVADAVEHHYAEANAMAEADAAARAQEREGRREDASAVFNSPEFSEQTRVREEREAQNRAEAPVEAPQARPEAETGKERGAETERVEGVSDADLKPTPEEAAAARKRGRRIKPEDVQEPIEKPTEEKPNETRNGADEAPAQPEQRVERTGEPETRPLAGAEKGAEPPRDGVVEPVEEAAKPATRRQMRSMKADNVIKQPDSWDKYGELQGRLLKVGQKGGTTTNTEMGKKIKAELDRMDESGWGELYRASMEWAGSDKKTRGEAPPNDLEGFREWKAKREGAAAPKEAPKGKPENATWIDLNGKKTEMDGWDAPTDGNVAKGATIAVKNDRNTMLYDGEVVSVGPKNVKIRTGGGMGGGETVLTFPRKDVVGVKRPAESAKPAANEPKRNPADNFKGYTYDDYGAPPNTDEATAKTNPGGTGDVQGAALLSHRKESNRLFYIPESKDDPLWDWYQEFNDGNARKNRRGDFIALFGMNPKKGRNDAFGDDLPPELWSLRDKGAEAVAEAMLKARKDYAEWVAKKRNGQREAKAERAEGDAAFNDEAAERAAAADLSLESMTPEQAKAEEAKLAEQKRKAEEKEEIERRKSAPLKGGGEDVSQGKLDLGGAEGEDTLWDAASGELIDTRTGEILYGKNPDYSPLKPEAKAEGGGNAPRAIRPAEFAWADGRRAQGASRVELPGIAQEAMKPAPKRAGGETATESQYASRDPHALTDPAFVAWAKSKGNRTPTPFARRAYDREKVLEAIPLYRNLFPGMKITYHDKVQDPKTWHKQHPNGIQPMRVGVRGAEKANDIPAMRNYNVAETMLVEKPWSKMSLDEKRKFTLATGYQVGADGMLKRQVPDFGLTGEFKAKVDAFDAAAEKMRKLADAADSTEMLGKYGSKMFDGAMLDYYLEHPDRLKHFEDTYEKFNPARARAIRDFANAAKEWRSARDMVFSGKLADVISGEGAELLRRYYPDIDEIRFRIEHTKEPGLMGWFDNAKNEIVITQNGIAQGGKDIHGTLLHEVQHFIQHKEGFGVGGSQAAKIYYDLRGLDYILKDPRYVLESIEHLIQRPKSALAGIDKEVITATFPSLNTESPSELKRAAETLKRALPFVDKVKAHMESQGGRFSDDIFESYRRLMGEVESRDTQHRFEHPENRGKLFEETEEYSPERQIDNRAFNDLVELATDGNVSFSSMLNKDGDAPYRMIVDQKSGETLGWYTPDFKEVHLNPGADVGTLAHEVLHAAQDWAKSNSPKLYSALEKIANDCPRPLKQKILRAYGIADPATIIKEWGAFNFMGGRHGGKGSGGEALLDELAKRENQGWLGRMATATKDVWKDMAAKMGLNRIDLSAIDSKTPQEAMDYLARAFAQGGTLGKVKAQRQVDPRIDMESPLSKREKWEKGLHDYRDPLKRLRDDMAERGVAFDDGSDFYEASRLQKGKDQAAVNEANRRLDRYLKMLKEGGVTHEEVVEFMQAQATPDRNRMIRDKFGREDGSGLTDAEAAKTIKAFEDAGKIDALNRISDFLLDMQTEGLQYRVDTGLLDGEMAQMMLDREPKHVPFRSAVDEATGDYLEWGSDGSFAKPEFHTAKGRKTLADDVVSWMFAEYVDAYTRGNENMTRKMLADAIRLNPAMGVGKILMGARKTGEFDFSSGGYKRTKDGDALVGKKADVAIVNDPAYRESRRNGDGGRRNVLAFKEGGKAHFIEFAEGERGEALQAAVNGRDLKRMPEAWNKVMRFWSSTATEWSPTFALRNAFADNIDVFGNYVGEYGAIKGAAAYGKHVKNVAQLTPALAQYIATGKIPKGDMGRWIERYEKAGGSIAGFTNEGYGDIAAKIDVAGKAGQSRGKAIAKGLAMAAPNIVKGINKYSELATRIAAFRTQCEMGMTDHKAAMWSRESTVDFNMKGNATGVTNALWMFSNSTLGASARQLKSLFSTKRGFEVAGTFAAFGLIEGFAECLMNGDDDEREAQGLGTGKDVNEYTRANSIYVRSGDKVYRVPFHAGPFSYIKYAGNCMARAMMGRLSMKDAAKELGAEAASQLFHYTGAGSVNLQSQSGKFTDDAATFFGTAAPSLLQPFMQGRGNIDYAGRSIYNEGFAGDRTPRSERGRKSTPEWAKGAAKWLNEATRAEGHEKGYIDLPPEIVKMAGEAVGKNLLRDVFNAATTIGMMFGKEKMDVRNIPVVRDFVRPVDGNDRRFYEAKKEYEANVESFRKRRGEMSPAERKEYLQKFPHAKTDADGKARHSELLKRIDRLRKMEDGFKFTTPSKSVPHEWPEEKVEEFKKKRRELQAKFLKAMGM